MKDNQSFLVHSNLNGDDGMFDFASRNGKDVVVDVIMKVSIIRRACIHHQGSHIMLRTSDCTLTTQDDEDDKEHAAGTSLPQQFHTNTSPHHNHPRPSLLNLPTHHLSPYLSPFSLNGLLARHSSLQSLKMADGDSTPPVSLGHHSSKSDTNIFA